MDHAEALALIERAAAEPARLRDVQEDADPAWRALREHLASCDPCRREYLSWSRLGQALAAVTPDREPVERAPAGLRDATLALVRAAGVERGECATPAPAAGAPGEPVRSAESRPDGDLPAGAVVGVAPRVGRRLHWSRPALAGLAAAAAVIVLLGGLAVTSSVSRQLEAARSQSAELAWVAGTVDRLMQTPDHRVVVLTSTTGGGAGGSVIWSPGSGTLVVLSQTLPPPPAGMTYRCWVLHGGTRQPVGEMHVEDGLAYWAGPLAEWGGVIQAGDQFGVSLVPATGGPSGTPVLTGSV